MKPYYHDEAGITIYCGDCRTVLPLLEEADCVVTDPPYGDTSLEWDAPVSGWLPIVKLKPSGSLWCFGSMRMFVNDPGLKSGACNRRPSGDPSH